jgi:hypothetical protein
MIDFLGSQDNSKPKTLITYTDYQLAMNATKPVIFVDISFLVVTLFYSPSITFAIMNSANEPFATCTPAGKSDGSSGSSSVPADRQLVKCCWLAYVDAGEVQTYCSTCEDGGTRGKINCTDPVQQFTGQIPGDIIAPQDRVFQDSTPPTLPGSIPPAADRNVLQQDDGVLQQQPAADEGTGATAPRTIEAPTPICAPGSVFDPDINECVLENPPELCPDGSTSQPTVPAGPLPKCPPSEEGQSPAEG